MSKLVALVSGGLDSGTLATKLVQDENEVWPVSFRYGQKHEESEIGAALNVCWLLGIANRHQVFNIQPLFENNQTSSVLLKHGLEMPHMTYEQLAAEVGPSPTYVPYRNGLFISIATSYALQIGATEVYIATHAEDARNWAYPDCTLEFNGPQAAAVWVGSYHKVRLFTPFQWMMKSDIVKLGNEIKAPFASMWSCYEGGDKPCGKCPTCIERAEAFRVNGLVDPAIPV